MSKWATAGGELNVDLAWLSVSRMASSLTEVVVMASRSDMAMLMQTDDDLRPINPPIINEVDVLWNPFEDIVPRSTKEDREEAAVAKK